MVRTLFQHMDVPGLAGFNRFIGVDLTERRARVVVLKRAKPGRYDARFVAEAAFTVEFLPGLTVAQKGEELQRSLLHSGVSARWAASSVRSVGVKMVTTHVPSSVEDINEWIKENYDKLIKLPLTSDEVAFRYEILGPTSSGTVVEIAFVRVADLDTCKRIVKAAGLDLAALGVGVRDALNALLLTSPEAGRGECAFVYVDDDAESLFLVRDGKRTPGNHFSLRGPGDVSKPPETVFRGGHSADGASDSVWQNDVRPFGLPSEFCLAAGLALKGFLPELNSLDFLDTAEYDHFAGMVHRSLARRVAIVLGAAMILLLFVPGVASLIFSSRSAAPEDPGSTSAEIDGLERQVGLLENHLYGNEQMPVRTEVARILHDIAAAVPESVWLRKLTIENKSQEPAQVTLTGVSTSGDQVSRFIRALEGPCSDVRLLSFGVHEEQYPVRSKLAKYPAFEISAVTKP